MTSEYIDALERAGAVIVESAEHGSYQGMWMALVRHEGAIKLVAGDYGSCSACDAFEAEVGWRPYVTPEEAPEEWDRYFVKVCRFGQGYLNEAMDPIQAWRWAAQSEVQDWNSFEETDYYKRVFIWLRKYATPEWQVALDVFERSGDETKARAVLRN